MDDASTTGFSKDGFTQHPIRVFSASQAALYLHQLEEYETAIGEIKGHYRFQTHLILPWVAELVHNPDIIGAAARVLGTKDLLVWFTEWHIKEAQSAGHYTWHQDAAYAGLTPAEDVVTAWVALTESNCRNGCVRFIPGSHREGLQHLEAPEPSNLLMLRQYIPDHLLDLQNSKVVELLPGEATLHTFRCVHASGPNTDTQRRRIGLAIRYMKPSVTQLGSLREGAMLVKGADMYGHFDLRQPPSELWNLKIWRFTSTRWRI